MSPDLVFHSMPTGHLPEINEVSVRYIRMGNPSPLLCEMWIRASFGWQLEECIRLNE